MYTSISSNNLLTTLAWECWGRRGTTSLKYKCRSALVKAGGNIFLKTLKTTSSGCKSPNAHLHYCWTPSIANYRMFGLSCMGIIVREVVGFKIFSINGNWLLECQNLEGRKRQWMWLCKEVVEEGNFTVIDTILLDCCHSPCERFGGECCM